MGRRDGCRGKVKHRTRQAAIAAMRAMHNLQLNTYKCKLCGSWHVGNSTKPWKVQARIDQILNRDRLNAAEKEKKMTADKEEVWMNADEALKAQLAMVEEAINRATLPIDRAAWGLLKGVLPVWTEWLQSHKVNGEIAMTALVNLIGKLGAEVLLNTADGLRRLPLGEEEKNKMEEGLIQAGIKAMVKGVRDSLEIETSLVINDPETRASKVHVRLKQS